MSKDPKAMKQPGVEKLQLQIADLEAALKRERADSENIRRRHEAQLTGLRTSLKAQIIKDLLPVIDNFERAILHVPKELAQNDYIKGVNAVVQQFEKTLQQLGVTRIKTVGQAFDPHLHEAVSLDDGEGQQEVVSHELQAGYILGEDVIRHAMVRVKMQ